MNRRRRIDKEIPKQEPVKEAAPTPTPKEPEPKEEKEEGKTKRFKMENKEAATEYATKFNGEMIEVDSKNGKKFLMVIIKNKAK